MSAKSQPSHLNAESGDVGLTKAHSRRLIPQGLETNAMFKVHGKTLKGWLKEENFNLAPLLRAFDSILAIPLMILLVLLIWAPSLSIAIILSTRYRYDFDVSARGGSLPVSFSICIGLAPFSLGVSMVRIFEFFGYRSRRKDSKQQWDDWTHLVSPSKRLIVADKGFLAMVDDRAMVGDMLFSLVGCPESVVLRKVGRGRNRYVIVGSCYIHLTLQDENKYLGPDRTHCNLGLARRKSRGRRKKGQSG